MRAKFDEQDNWLPSFPAVGLHVLQLLSNEDVEVAELADTIRDDPAITAKILKYANSPLLGARARVATIEHAISWLGKKQVSAIALSFSLSESRTTDRKLKKHFDNFWLESFVAATAFESMASSMPTLDTGQAYVSGILMGIGKLVLLDTYPTGYTKIIDEADDGRPIEQIEIEELGLTSSEIGSELLKRLNLPQVYIEVAKHHGCEIDETEYMSGSEYYDYVLTSVAAKSYADFFCRKRQAQSLNVINRVMSTNGHEGREAVWLLDDVRKRCERKAELYNARISVIPPNAELLSTTVQQLLEVEASVVPLTNYPKDGWEEQKIEYTALRAKIGMLGIIEEDDCLSKLNPSSEQSEVNVTVDR